VKKLVVLSLVGLLMGAVGCASSPDAKTSTKSKVSTEKTDNETVSLAGLFGLMGPSMSKEEKQVAIEKASDFPLGTKQNPIRTQGPAGQREYLSRLVCEDLRMPYFERAGNVGPGPYGSIVDLYIVECRDSQPEKAEIFMDMYFPGHVEAQAVDGFEIQKVKADDK